MYAGDFYPVLFCMLKLVSFDCDFLFISQLLLLFFSFRSWGPTGEGSLVVVVLLLLQRLLWDTFSVQWCVWKCAFG